MSPELQSGVISYKGIRAGKNRVLRLMRAHGTAGARAAGASPGRPAPCPENRMRYIEDKAEKASGSGLQYQQPGIYLARVPTIHHRLLDAVAPRE